MTEEKNKIICLVLGKNEHQVLNLLEGKPLSMPEIRTLADNLSLQYYSGLADLLLRLIVKRLVKCTISENELFHFRHSKKDVQEKSAHKFSFFITEKGKLLLKFFKN
jgi:hypothetical protein